MIRCGPRAYQNPWQLIEEVSSFADILFAKTDVRVWMWAIPCFVTLTVEAMFVSCVATWAENHAAADCLALCTSPIWDLENAMYICQDNTSKTPCFDTITIEIDMCLVRGYPS